MLGDVAGGHASPWWQRTALDLFIGGLVVGTALLIGVAVGALAALWAYLMLLLTGPLYGFDEAVLSTVTLWSGVVVGVLVAVGWLGHGVRKSRPT